MEDKAQRGKLINDLEVGSFLTIKKIRFGGALQARKLASGATQFYWRYTHDGLSDRVPVGPYDPSAPPKRHAATSRGYSVLAAELYCEHLARQHKEALSTGGYRAAVASKAIEHRSVAAEAEALKEHTLQKLLCTYCDYLQSLGRPSHRDARSIFKLHVLEANPQVAQLSAADVTGEQVADLMRQLIEAGKGRTANKLRSYLRAAYQLARSAMLKPSVPLAFKAFAIKHNPAGDTEADSAENKADKNPLSLEDLRGYWKNIGTISGSRGIVLRLHVLTGGQRIEQFVKLKTVDIVKDLKAIKLFDKKGRPGTAARLHIIPLTPLALKNFKDLGAVGEYAFSTDGGKTHIAATTLSGWAKDANGSSIVDFQAKRVRSGIETLLASRKVSQEIRGRLQSHGLAGVQNRHYNAYEYLAEKQDALKVLLQALTTSGARGKRSVTGASPMSKPRRNGNHKANSEDNVGVV